MKFRQGFVSNSSSSSFIITDKDNIIKAMDLINNCKEGYYDYYLINSKLYTSPISNDYDFWYIINDLSAEDLEHHGDPYNDEKEVEGDRGVTTVYVPKYEFTQAGKNKRHIKDELYSLCKKWVYDHKFQNYGEIEDEMNLNSDILDDMTCLIEKIYNIVGYYQEEVNDEN